MAIALGIGANATTFSAIDRLPLRCARRRSGTRSGLPVRAARTRRAVGSNFARGRFRDPPTQLAKVASIGGVESFFTMTVGTGGDAHSQDVLFVDAAYFGALEAGPRSAAISSATISALRPGRLQS